MNVYEKLMTVQTKLRAPKGQYNSFGKYSYRSCEDILEALKPLLAEVGAIINITDEIKVIGDNFETMEVEDKNYKMYSIQFKYPRKYGRTRDEAPIQELAIVFPTDNATLTGLLDTILAF